MAQEKNILSLIAKNIFALCELGKRDNLTSIWGKLRCTFAEKYVTVCHVSNIKGFKAKNGNFLFLEGEKSKRRKWKAMEEYLRRSKITKPPSEIDTIGSLKKVQAKSKLQLCLPKNLFSLYLGVFSHKSAKFVLKKFKMQKMQVLHFFPKWFYFTRFYNLKCIH